MKPIGILFVFIIFCNPGITQNKIISGDSLLLIEKTLEKLDRKINFTVIPGPVYNSSTQLGFAVIPMLVYNLDKADTVTPPSSTSALLYFNTHWSWMFSIKQNLYWDHNKWRAIISFGYGNLKSKFFGAENDSMVINNNTDNYGWISDKTLFVTATCYRKIAGGFYGGLEYSYSSILQQGADSASTSRMLKNNVHVGNDITSILSPTFVWDNRDDLFWSTKGYYAGLNFRNASNLFFSSRDFLVIEAFLNGYHCLSKKSKRLTLAWRLYIQGCWGDVPYIHLAKYGEGDDFRGYTGGKYVNRSKANLQAELRYDIWKFIAVSGFLGTGKTFGNIANFGQSVWLPSAGIGIYLNVIPTRNIRAYINFAIAREDYGIYVGLGQAF
ncbi:MAG: BamA/TamA family outer membrane protein [Bacteroidetes bacterium]|nr:BamA/TamA family outer membrane protein [Bacteroidota bacterium]